MKSKRTLMGRYLVILHVILMAYSLFGIFSKFASHENFLSARFIFFYGIVVFNLGIYAICWQQIIKHMPLMVAFANKAVTVVWGIVWGRLFFGEIVTVPKVIGAIIIIGGISLVVTEKEEENG